MSLTDIGLLVLRLGLGLTFAAHGAQKAFGWWGGPGPARWRGAVEGMGFTPSSPFAAISTAIELVGGLLVAIGVATPLAAAALVAQSIVIVIHAHWPKGFFSTAGGYEHPLLLGLVAASICLIGAGALSIDAALGLHPDGRVRLICLAVGIVAGAVAVLVPRGLGERLGRGGVRRT